MASIEARPYVAVAEEYARDVTSGKIPACKSIRLQCRRFLLELKRQRRRDFPFRFDAAKAERVCRFIERLPHSKGKWARAKETIRLEPWQVFALVVPFGWLRKADGLRRFRVLFIVVPRKNGKSALSAGIGLYMLCADGEYGAEVYSGATNEKQAWEVFGPARLMAQRTPALCSRFGVDVNARSLVRVDDNSKFETIIGDPGDGQSPSCSIHDEYHEHDDDGQVDTMQTGMGARDQPLQVLITTAGDNLAGPCYARIHDERKKLGGSGPPLHDETFFLEFTIDEGDDWKSEAALIKANPNFDVSVSGEFLRARQRDAIATPRKAGVFKTKHLNLWVSAKAAWFDVEAWRRCRQDWIPVRAAEGLALEQLRGRRCILGLDLATKIDIAGLEYLFPPVGEAATAEDPFIRIGRYFLPGARVEEVPAYQAWDAQALLDVTDGNVTDFSEIERAILEAGSQFQVEAVAFDPWQATQLAQRMMAEGVPMLEYRMTVQNLSAPMKELDALTKAGTIAHGGCPVMEWEISNVVGKLDLKDNVFPNKPVGQDHLKIDNPVALMMALGVAMSREEEPMATSPWDDPEYSVFPAGEA
ncbi:MAG TPA: terminase TerL endonuclease subunit [Sphingomicrobium sp.]|nr:terminase TerL endonuclease subunit [Sphingomicrobium sp.]